MEKVGNFASSPLLTTMSKVWTARIHLPADGEKRLICFDCRMCLRRAKSHTLHMRQFINIDCKIKTCSSEVFDRLLCFYHNLSNSHLGVPFPYGSMLSVVFVRGGCAINLANLRQESLEGTYVNMEK